MMSYWLSSDKSVLGERLEEEEEQQVKGIKFTEEREPSWIECKEYRVKLEKPKKKTITLFTWCVKRDSGEYYTVEGTGGFISEYGSNWQLLSTREVEIDV